MKLKIDTHSIKFKITLYFILFAVVIMLILWTCQVFMLNNFYASMKTSQTYELANSIKASFKLNDEDSFLEEVADVSQSYDMYIFLVSYDGTTMYFTPGSEDYTVYDGFTYEDDEDVEGNGEKDDSDENRGPLMQKEYIEQISTLNDKIVANGGSASIKFQLEGENSQDVFAYGSLLHSKKKVDMVLYVFSPLWPIQSTIRILTSQLQIVSILAFLLACGISFYLSFRITRPLRKMERSAKRLAEGEYGIVFRGGHYTELMSLADTLTSASIDLEKSDLLQKDLIANVSHDLRTPLTLIKSYAEMIRDLSGDNPEKRNEHLKVIINESDRLNALVEDFLAMSKMQSGKITLEPKTFNISEAVTSLADTYKVMEDDGYTININCTPNLQVVADEDKIKQVIANLISNAVKFSGDDKTVDISLVKKGRNVSFSVEDHGIGISEEDLDHIWDRYYRASSNMAREAEGSGLGLAICKEILTLHKAEFGVESTLGQGSKFWFELEQKRDSVIKLDAISLNRNKDS